MKCSMDGTSYKRKCIIRLIVSYQNSRCKGKRNQIIYLTIRGVTYLHGTTSEETRVFDSK